MTPPLSLTGDCTVATAGLLLVNVTLAAAAGAAVTVTVPCAMLPIPIVDALSVTPDTAGPWWVGEVGELELPHPPADTAADKTSGEDKERAWLRQLHHPMLSSKNRTIGRAMAEAVMRLFRCGEIFGDSRSTTMIDLAWNLSVRS